MTTHEWSLLVVWSLVWSLNQPVAKATPIVLQKLYQEYEALSRVLTTTESFRLCLGEIQDIQLKSYVYS